MVAYKKYYTKENDVTKPYSNSRDFNVWGIDFIGLFPYFFGINTYWLLSTMYESR